MRDGPGQRRREPATRAAVALGVALSALILVIRPLSVVVPGSGLDESWIAVLGEAASHPIRWGVDLAFSYGPASTLLTRYFTDDYFVLNLPFWVATALVFGISSAWLIRSPGQHLTAPILAIGGVQLSALASQASQDLDAFVVSLAFNLYLLDLVRPDRAKALRCVLIGGAALLGALGLAKTSLGVFGLAFMVLADCRSLSIGRRPWLTLTFLCACLVGFVALGQRLADLPTFVAMQWSFAAGYADAMWIDGNSIELAAYLVTAAALVALAAATGTGGERRWAALGVACATAVGLKAGFVRADSHTQMAWSLLGLTGLSIAAALVLPRSARLAAAVGAGCLALLWIWTPLVFILDTHRPKQLSELAAVYGGMADAALAEATAWVLWLPDPEAYAAGVRVDKAAAWADVRDQDPLPPLQGTVDMLASRQSGILAHRLGFHPRPSFQEYASYDRRLIAANVAFYVGESRPDWVLFGLKPIDGRYPAFTEGALWPILLSRYELVGQTGSLLALRARPLPMADALGPPQHAALVMGSSFRPPAGLIYAHAQVRKTMFGRLTSLLFRVPGLEMKIVTADGQDRSYRLVPAIAEEGFLLSPAIADVAQFAALASGGALASRQVVSVSIASPGLASSLFYQPEISVDFQTISPRPPAAEVQATARQLGMTDPGHP